MYIRIKWNKQTFFFLSFHCQNHFVLSLPSPYFFYDMKTDLVFFFFGKCISLLTPQNIRTALIEFTNCKFNYSPFMHTEFGKCYLRIASLELLNISHVCQCRSVCVCVIRLIFSILPFWKLYYHFSQIFKPIIRIQMKKKKQKQKRKT